jgi:hypothetical protein
MSFTNVLLDHAGKCPVRLTNERNFVKLIGGPSTA